MTVVKRRPKKAAAASLDLDALRADYRHHRMAKATEAEAKKTKETFRDRVMAAIERHGRPHGEHGQHLAIELGEDIDGTSVLVRRANVSSWLNVERAEELAREGGYLSEVTEGRVTLSFAGTTEQAAEVAALLGAVDWDEDAPLVSIQTSSHFSQERMMAYYQRTKDEPAKAKGPSPLTAELLDSLYEDETKYSFVPE